MQATLLEFRRNFVNGFRDSAFSGNRELPLHRWVPWIAGFSAQFVDDSLARYLLVNGKRPAWVLDPFAGVGSTLVQAYVGGFNIVGFGINPYAVLASPVKWQATEINSVTVGRQEQRRHSLYRQNGVCTRLMR